MEAGNAMSLVVTQPDRPRGRGMEVAFSPVKEAALRLSIPVTQPDKIKTNDVFREQLTALQPDAIIVVGYGRIIPHWMLDLPRHGNLNLHASLLPKYRGAAPIQWAIANGETVTGVTTMRIDAGLDTGDILQQREVSIDPSDTSESLASKLATVGADLMIETLERLQDGTIQPTPQDHARATLAPILKKEDGRMNFQLSAREIHNRLRGFQPWPGAFSLFRGKHLQIHRAAPSDGRIPSASAELSMEGTRLFVGCANGSMLELMEVQPEGTRRMTAADFVNGYRPKPGEKLGE